MFHLGVNCTWNVLSVSMCFLNFVHLRISFVVFSFVTISKDKIFCVLKIFSFLFYHLISASELTCKQQSGNFMASSLDLVGPVTSSNLHAGFSMSLKKMLKMKHCHLLILLMRMHWNNIVSIVFPHKYQKKYTFVWKF